MMVDGTAREGDRLNEVASAQRRQLGRKEVMFFVLVEGKRPMIVRRTSTGEGARTVVRDVLDALDGQNAVKHSGSGRVRGNDE